MANFVYNLTALLLIIWGVRCIGYNDGVVLQTIFTIVFVLIMLRISEGRNKI